MSARASRRDWCMTGLTLLRDQGYLAITLDRLCAALAKTKGSFYHHFTDTEEYLAEVLTLWEAELTERPIETSERESSPRRKSKRLDEAVIQLDHRLDRAVRAWALHDERARKAMDRVDRRRIAYITELHREAGHKQPAALALLEYASFVGAQHLDLFEHPEQVAKMNRDLRRALAVIGS
jgi:AcrR family transcriptional regulator